MNEVRAISDEDKLFEMLMYLKVNNKRNYILFLLGLHTGLRISDILKLRVKDVYKKDKIFVREKKTNKKKEIVLTKSLRKELNVYCNARDPEEFIFKSREGINKPIDRTQAYRIINKTAKAFGISNVGCHSLRKTFGRKHYKKYEDLEELRRIFNHSNSGITSRYIGLEQEIIDTHILQLWD